MSELTTEELVSSYERAGKAERKLVRDLKRAGAGQRELRTVLEVFHHFPSAKLLDPHTQRKIDAPHPAHGQRSVLDREGL